MSVQLLADTLLSLLTNVGDFLAQFTLLRPIVHYIQKSYQHDPVRILVEIILFLFVLRYLLNKDDRQKGELTEKDIEMLVREWEPEPLVPPSTRREVTDDVVIEGACGREIKLKGCDQRLQNWCSLNFLGIQDRPAVTEIAINTVRNYGVGACGPAGFYGSLDVHLALERKIAEMLAVEEAIIYSQGFMAVASVIPAFCKRGDVIVADDGVNFAIQSGMEISRSHLYFFTHNDMEDLERVLGKVERDMASQKVPLSRRFLVVEGLYQKHGDKCNLPQILHLKRKYKYRLIMDESLSFGTIGKSGLGISEYYGIPTNEIEIITGSFSASLGSSGGFCAGSHEVVDHQRLSSQAYCYSAALPAFLATAAMENLTHITPNLIDTLKKNCILLDKKLMKRPLPEQYICVGNEDSPLRYIRLRNRSSELEEEAILKQVIVKMKESGFHVCMDRHVKSREKFLPPPSLKICMSAAFTEEEIESFYSALLTSLY